ncbi:MAG TPA: tetratricopeptide repeat protein, partial [Chroococcales cyanobacterium]
KSVDSLSRAIAIDPAEKQGLIARARLERSLGHPEKAAADYTAALKFDPHSPYFARHALEELLSDRGQNYMEAKQYKKAAEDFETLLKDDPDDAVFQLYLGDCRVALGELPAALSAYNKAISLDPEGGSTYFARAHVYDLMHRPDLAGADRQMAQKLGFTPKPKR